MLPHGTSTSIRTRTGEGILRCLWKITIRGVVLIFVFLQEHRTSQLPLDIEDDRTSVKSNETDMKGTFGAEVVGFAFIGFFFSCSGS